MATPTIPYENKRLLQQYVNSCPELMEKFAQSYETAILHRAIQILSKFWEFLTNDPDAFIGYSDPEDPELSIRIQNSRMFWMNYHQGVSQSKLDWEHFFSEFRTEIIWYLKWCGVEEELRDYLIKAVKLHQVLIKS